MSTACYYRCVLGQGCGPDWGYREGQREAGRAFGGHTHSHGPDSVRCYRGCVSIIDRVARCTGRGRSIELSHNSLQSMFGHHSLELT
ncbi:hypothetical protein ElyMa_001709300 [Elysia marginata]|uniref:Uncharacterized protein n=1 Tax=Elysia marginata TaxID=1093978 RepID=A0AAV4JWS6_9GAST|nr:hypothetical protein ElyMa_001709300 [Elysia marginata]